MSGLQNKVAEPHANLHMAGMSAWLTATHPTPARTGISLDQVVANAPGWKGTTTFASLELGGDSASPLLKGGSGQYEGLPKTFGLTTSFNAAGAPRPTETNPQAVFDRLFGGASVPSASSSTPTSPTATTSAAERRRIYRSSILDVVRGQAERLKSRVGTADRRRLDGYLTSVRELETQLQGAAAVPGGDPRPVSVPAAAACQAPGRPAATMSYPDRLKAMLDMVALAVQCDRTRVITLLLAEAESENPFTFLDIKTPTSGDRGHHGASHYG